MKVRCVRIINSVTGEEMQRSPWLTIGRDYIVLSVDVYRDKEVSFRLISDHSPSPAMFDSREFEVMSGRLPSNWVAWNDETGAFGLRPKKWLRPGFWEDYFNDIPEAIRDFEEERNVIMAEAT
jgi:hypothetical protein